jgi:protein phosphatase 1K
LLPQLKRSFVAADKDLLSAKGFMGMGERGVGGSKCGSTAATLLVYKDAKDGTQIK